MGGTERKPARRHYDAIVDLAGKRPSQETVACAIVKFTFRIDHAAGRLVLDEPMPLENDLRDEALDPRLPAHSDFWLQKEFTDVGVIGSAYAVDANPVREMVVGVQVGRAAKKVAVFGDREIEFTASGQAEIGPAKPFTEMPLAIERAYGGCDFRVPIADDDPQIDSVLIEADYPGLYPRNPWGRGYLAVPDPIEGMQLPNLENPRDLLTHDRLVAKSPERWYEQPMPWHLDWLPINCFPRNLFLAIECEPWYPPPEDDSLAEVRMGILPGSYRTHLEHQTFGVPPHWRFRQEAAHGLTLKKMPTGAPVVLVGMHPEHPVIEFTLPGRHPRIDMTIENATETLEPRLSSLAIYPDIERVAMTYTVAMRSPRTFIPGIHKHIPISISVSGDRPLHYETPKTVRQRLDEAKQEEAT